MREIAAGEPYHLGRTLSGQRMGRYDPTCRVLDDRAHLALWTPEGPATLAAAQDGSTLRVRAWGEGGDWLLARADALLGLHDAPADFREAAPTLRDLARRFAGMRLPTLPRVFGRLAAIVLLQLVTHDKAVRSWRRLVSALGEPAPGPHGLRLAPTPERIRESSVDELIAMEVLPRQARTLRLAAKHAVKIERAAEQGVDALRPLLSALSGVGPWTVQYALGSALGYPDAVLVGDYNLPSSIAWALERIPRADDVRMLQLLAPYRGERFRVIRLVWLSGEFAPRRGPRVQGALRSLR